MIVANCTIHDVVLSDCIIDKVNKIGLTLKSKEVIDLSPYYSDQRAKALNSIRLGLKNGHVIELQSIDEEFKVEDSSLQLTPGGYAPKNVYSEALAKLKQAEKDEIERLKAEAGV